MNSLMQEERDDHMWTIDGSRGEGGGQILRTALSLSLATGTPITLEKIRGGRKKPGLLRQHLTAVQAAAAIAHADLEGDRMGSQELRFSPEMSHPGSYEFRVGTAGSALLVLQSLYMPLLLAEGPTTLRLSGGTHARQAPPFEFFAEVLAPLLRRAGAEVQVKLKKYGFFPAGGGELEVHLKPPAEGFQPLHLRERGELREREILAISAHLPKHVADREALTAAELMGWPIETARIHRTRNAACPGNVVMIRLAFDSHQELFTAFGERGVRAEDVAADCAAQARAYLESDAVVGEHLADQLLLPMALGAGGSFLTGPLSGHAQTQVDLLRELLGVEIHLTPLADELLEVRVVT